MTSIRSDRRYHSHQKGHSASMHGLVLSEASDRQLGHHLQSSSSWPAVQRIPWRCRAMGLGKPERARIGRRTRMQRCRPAPRNSPRSAQPIFVATIPSYLARSPETPRCRRLRPNGYRGEDVAGSAAAATCPVRLCMRKLVLSNDRRIGDHGAAVTVALCGKASGRVLAI
jgi:hypothetical protein